jgi:exodeoxyribonuclease-3
MKVVTWNVNGIRACYSKGLKDFIANQDPDILCLQETKAHLEQVPPEMRDLGYPYSQWWSAKRKGYSGVATFSKLAFEPVIGWGRPEWDDEGRVLIARWNKLDIYNIYFPNGGSGDERHQFKQRFLADLLQHLRGQLAQGRSIMVVGDYNVAPYPEDVFDPVRLAQESGFLPEEREWFQKFFALGFVDTFRVYHPNEKNRYSWWSYREFARVSNRGWRIDFICISQDLLPHLKDANLCEEVQGSDHCPVYAEFDASLLD